MRHKERICHKCRGDVPGTDKHVRVRQGRTRTDLAYHFTCFVDNIFEHRLLYGATHACLRCDREDGLKETFIYFLLVERGHGSTRRGMCKSCWCKAGGFGIEE